tara:strand:+ start:319 stop:645 length:327 start_codon:yes stop_codon:yes gene_type:complete
MIKCHVKKGDNVIVTSGRSSDRGKTGEVLRVFPEDQKVLVKGVRVVKKHQKPSQSSAGGIVEKELPIHISNVMHIDPKTKEPTRIGYKVLDDGRKVRIAKKSGDQIDS